MEADLEWSTDDMSDMAPDDQDQEGEGHAVRLQQAIQYAVVGHLKESVCGGGGVSTVLWARCNPECFIDQGNAQQGLEHDRHILVVFSLSIPFHIQVTSKLLIVRVGRQQYQQQRIK